MLEHKYYNQYLEHEGKGKAPTISPNLFWPDTDKIRPEAT